MIDHMSKILDGEISGESLKKPVKPQDLVRLYETIIQNLADMPQLAGLDEDLGFKHEVSHVCRQPHTFYYFDFFSPKFQIEAKVTYFKAWRCHFLAQSIMAAQKWSEAMALYQRATTYAKKAKNDKTLEGK